MTPAAQLYKLFVILETNAIVGPHAVVIHQKDTLVAHAAMVRPQRLYKVALVAESFFLCR